MFKSALTLCWISLAIVTQVDCNDNSAVFAHCFPSALLPLFLDGSNISFLTFFTINIFARTPILWVPPSACSWLKQVSYSSTTCLSSYSSSTLPPTPTIPLLTTTSPTKKPSPPPSSTPDHQRHLQDPVKVKRHPTRSPSKALEDLPWDLAGSSLSLRMSSVRWPLL